MENEFANTLVSWAIVVLSPLKDVSTLFTLSHTDCCSYTANLYRAIRTKLMKCLLAQVTRRTMEHTALGGQTYSWSNHVIFLLLFSAFFSLMLLLRRCLPVPLCLRTFNHSADTHTHTYCACGTIDSVTRSILVAVHIIFMINYDSGIWLNNFLFIVVVFVVFLFCWCLGASNDWMRVSRWSLFCARTHRAALIVNDVSIHMQSLRQCGQCG